MAETLVGTNGFGPMMADMSTFSLYSHPQSIPSISVRDIFLDEKNVWVGGISKGDGFGGITVWNDYENTWQYFEAPFYNGIAKDDVYVIDGNDHFVAFGTTYGLVVYDKIKSKWKTYTQFEGLEGDKINDVMIYKNTAYIGTENGFNWLDLNSKYAEGVSGTSIDNVEIKQLTIYQDTIYLATKLGLFGIDFKEKNVRFISAKSAIPDFNLTSIGANKNEIWIANNYGIAFLNKTQDSWFNFSDLNIKPDVRDIAFTDMVVWFATNQGLMKYDRETNNWRMFTTRDGLIDNNVYHIDVENDNLWLSTEKGFTIFNFNRPGRLD